MIGYATIDNDKLLSWIEEERGRLKNKNELPVWYTSLWREYFYYRQDIFKDATPIMSISGFWPDDRSERFLSLMEDLKSEDQRLCVYYRDEVAAIVGYQDHKYILPAEYVSVEYLKDYSNITSAELMTIGDKEMAGSLLPAGLDGYSVNTIKEDLDDKNNRIEEAEIKCQKAIEEIRREALKKEQELKELLEKETEKLRIAKEELENKLYVLDTQIYGIRCYLGEVVDFKQIRTGKVASPDTPVVMFQKIRFLDEEMGKYLSLYAFGSYIDDKQTLMEALSSRDDLRDIFCPADRCITVIRNSRTGKTVKMSKAIANMLERYEYLHGKQIAILVRDGENLYIGWTDDEKINISSEDMFLRPGVTSVSAAPDKEKDSYFNSYQEEKEEIIARNQERERRQRISRFFLISVIQGMIDRGGIINIPPKTKITEESRLVKFSFAEGWLKDSTYGNFDDIMSKSEHIPVKKGELVLTCLHVTRDDTFDTGKHYSSSYMAYSNNRGIGDKNRTHDASIPALKIKEINKILKESEITVTFTLYKGKEIVHLGTYFTYDNAKAYDVIRDDPDEVIGRYTVKMHLNEDDFNKAGTLTDYEKVIFSKYNDRPLWCVGEDGELDAISASKIRHEWLPDLTKYGIPGDMTIEVEKETLHTYISVPMDRYNDTGSRVNFEIMPDEYVRTSYLCSTWLKYIITTGNIGDFRIGGERLSYAESLKYLNKLMDHIKARETMEKGLLIDCDGGEKYINTHKKWDLDLCEWRIKNCIPALTSRSAKKFLKEINKNQ